MNQPSLVSAGYLFLLGALCACSSTRAVGQLPPEIEARTFGGKDLLRPTFAAEASQRLEHDLAAAESEHAVRPHSEMAAIWHARRLAYLGRYGDALEVLDAALEEHPASFKLLRHRGHRLITLRRLDAALADLKLASKLTRHWPDQYEPDGAPNAAGIPRSTTRSNIEYHLGLAYYLKGHFSKARQAWKRCRFFSGVNDDMLVAATYWSVLTLWRLGQWDEAEALLQPIRLEMEVLENHEYHELLLFYKGVLSEGDIVTKLWGDKLSSATLGYGLGAWNLVHGRSQEARALFTEILGNTNWSAFGHIAAEAELAR